MTIHDFDMARFLIGSEVDEIYVAHGAMMTSFPGDTTMATVEQVRAFAQGGSARIQR